MPNALTESFRSSHHLLLESIDQVYQVIRSYPQAKPRLRELGKVILVHLGRQNKTMLDRLVAHHQANRPTSKILEFLIHNLKDIKVKYLLFFDQHSGEPGDVNARNFSRDFQEFAGELINRIKMEEEYLFPLLEDLPAEHVNQVQEFEN